MPRCPDVEIEKLPADSEHGSAQTRTPWLQSKVTPASSGLLREAHSREGLASGTVSMVLPHSTGTYSSPMAALPRSSEYSCEWSYSWKGWPSDGSPSSTTFISYPM